jgi:hypothetical protein
MFSPRSNKRAERKKERRATETEKIKSLTLALKLPSSFSSYLHPVIQPPCEPIILLSVSSSLAEPQRWPSRVYSSQRTRCLHWQYQVGSSGLPALSSGVTSAGAAAGAGAGAGAAKAQALRKSARALRESIVGCSVGWLVWGVSFGRSGTWRERGNERGGWGYIEETLDFRIVYFDIMFLHCCCGES